MDFIMSRNSASALTLKADDDHSKSEGGMVKGSSALLLLCLLAQGCSCQCAWVGKPDPTMWSHSLGEKSDDWVKGKTCSGK